MSSIKIFIFENEWKNGQDTLIKENGINSKSITSFRD